MSKLSQAHKVKLQLAKNVLSGNVQFSRNIESLSKKKSGGYGVVDHLFPSRTQKLSTSVAKVVGVTQQE